MYDNIEYLLGKIVDNIRETNRILVEDKAAKGRTHGTTITMTVGKPMIKIFFDKQNYSSLDVLPDNTIIDFPITAVSRIIIVNEDESGCDIKYAVNNTPDETRATSILRANEEREIKVPRNTIFSLHMLAVTGLKNPGATSTSVRIETLS